MTENIIEKLGKAYCALNCWEWDSFCGDKPNGFDTMSNDEKLEIIGPIMQRIDDVIGTAGSSRAWWLYELNRSEDEWAKWYINPHRPD